MNCIFCKIINKEIPSYKVYEDDYVFAFLDVLPASKGHTLIVPKKHFDNFSSCDQDYLKHVAIAKNKIAKLIKEKLEPQGLNYLSNENVIAGQSVFHYHEHIIPKYQKDDGLILNPPKTNQFDLEEIFNKLK
ncbi:histidine triad (HIT) protein [Mycoplasma putrefaciens]|uniref:Histidine triad (HIT) protein n=1 Tax=Mycoplasma putrefaciens (strain ATCC 15718 / NCTC 10155 / C30 KS-1 / KS-1) TaxID=743965 RepID=A0A7U3ZSE4_MYCPK|nr:HIT family protein [Mycoplasma putrefaciens]AEM68643.1 Histidine triad (HIT) protein [Mycoplasma putrefaciens KS1]SYV95620.1 histidine triad (HIT) protein [Mycoplasma putrefaciens]